jgi:hypothetical protein
MIFPTYSQPPQFGTPHQHKYFDREKNPTSGDLRYEFRSIGGRRARRQIDAYSRPDCERGRSC